jgi:hypothetical protein
VAVEPSPPVARAARSAARVRLEELRGCPVRLERLDQS